MNFWDLSASDLLIWGVVLHLIADWPLQNDWMANKKQSLLHPAAYVHSGIQTLCLATVFGRDAFWLGIAHLLIDTRWPVIWWSKLFKQTQPGNNHISIGSDLHRDRNYIPLYDMGTEVRIWTDQVFHIVCIAVAALLIT